MNSGLFCAGIVLLGFALYWLISSQQSQVPETQKKPYEIAFKRAGDNFIAGDNRRALKYTDEAIALAPDVISLYELRAVLRLGENDPIGVVQDATKVIEAYPDKNTSEFYYFRGTAYAKLRQWDESLSDLQTALGLNMFNPFRCYIQIGQVLFLGKGETEEAIKAYNTAISLNPDHFAAYLGRALVFGKIKDHDAVIADYTKSLTLDNPERWRTYTGLGNAYWMKEMWDDALAAYRQALLYDGGSNYYGTYINIANILGSRKQQYAEAIQAYNQAIAINDLSTRAYSGRSSTYAKLGNAEGALADYQKAMTLEPQNAEDYNARGYLSLQREQYEQALADCSKAIELKPDWTSGYGSRGYTFFLMGKYEDALEDFNKALEVKPRHKFALAGAALCHYQLGQTDEAKQIWQSLIEVDEGYKQANTIQDDYDSHHPKLVETAEKVIALL